MNYTKIDIQYPPKTCIPITLGSLRPLQCALVLSECSMQGHLVMRTASTSSFEVIDLTAFKAGECIHNPKSPLIVQPIDIKLTVNIL
jgi:hypothetical protein